MNELIIKLIKNDKILKKDIELALFQMCDNAHSSCDSSCLIYELKTEEELLSNDCPYFKDGKKMIDFIKIRMED